MSPSYREQKSIWVTIVFWVIAVALVILVVLFFVFFKRVPPGTVGILVDYGKGTTTGQPSIKPVMPGRWYFVGILQDLQSYPFSQQSLTMVRRMNEGQVVGDDSVECKDNSGIQVNVDMTIIWKIVPEEIGPLYLNYPNRDIAQISDQLVRRLARQSAADACGMFGFIDIAGTGRIQFGKTTTDLLGPRLKAQHIELVDVSIGEVYLLTDQQNAITDKSIAQQKALQAQFLLQQRESEAQAAIAQAEGQKQVQILKAEGQAEAARVVMEQLGGRDYYIRYLWIDKWNGAVPYTLVTSDGQEFPLIVSLPAGTSTAPTPTP